MERSKEAESESSPVTSNRKVYTVPRRNDSKNTVITQMRKNIRLFPLKMKPAILSRMKRDCILLSLVLSPIVITMKLPASRAVIFPFCNRWPRCLICARLLEKFSFWWTPLWPLKERISEHCIESWWATYNGKIWNHSTFLLLHRLREFLIPPNLLYAWIPPSQSI